MNKFQIIIIAVFSFAAVFGVFLFATYRGGNANERVAVTIWGTLPETDFYAWYSQTPTSKNQNITLSYVFKRSETFDQEFVEALADGAGPDIIFLPHEKILEYERRIFPIPFTALSERQFRDMFVEGAEVYVGPEGIYALPLIIDPLVMYWNRDLFRNAVIPEVPRFWDEFPALATKLTKRDPAGNIIESAFALGEFANIHRAREIVSVLLLQAGTRITQRGFQGMQSVLPNNISGGGNPADAALTFYTQFANPAKDINTWNRSFTNSLNVFAAGDIAIFFGLASDIFAIQARNPNLNFDVALLPQPRDTSVRMTYGRMEGLAIVRQSRNIAGSYRVIQELTSSDSIAVLSAVLKLPPVRRDVLNRRPGDAYQNVFYDSALLSRAWLSPRPAVTDMIFRNMIEAITSGRLRMSEAIRGAHDELNRAFGQ